MKKTCILTLFLIAFAAGSTLAGGADNSKLFLELPETFNSPASADIDAEKNIYFTSPNFHNDVLIKAGEMKTPAAPTIGKVDTKNQLTTWYTFQPEDMEKSSGNGTHAPIKSTLPTCLLMQSILLT